MEIEVSVQDIIYAIDNYIPLYCIYSPQSDFFYIFSLN